MKQVCRSPAIAEAMAGREDERGRLARCVWRPAKHIIATPATAGDQKYGRQPFGHSSLIRHSCLDIRHYIPIPSESLENSAKCSVDGLENLLDCSLEAGLPGQAPSNWVKLNQTNVWKG